MWHTVRRKDVEMTIKGHARSSKIL